MKTFVMEKEGFDIYFEALEEDIVLDETFMEESILEETLEDIESGYSVLFCAKVSAHKNGIELGADYLGACIYESEEEFYTKYKDDYFADMVGDAILEAKNTLAGLMI